MNTILSEDDLKLLLEKGYVLLENSLAPHLIDELLEEIERLKKLNVFTAAGIGRGLAQKINENIRSDSLAWIRNWNEHSSLREYRKKVNALALELKENFFITIRSFEAHFSFYSQGEFYLKHIDQHKLSRHRQVTLVLYLSTLEDNEGGELILYDKDDKEKVLNIIHPKKGSLVVFFSSWLYHEVKPSQKDRYSLTGWLRDDDELGIA